MEMSINGQSYKWNLEFEKRALINQLVNEEQPEKELQDIINREGAGSPVGQYAKLLLNVMPETIREHQPLEDRYVLPVVICARNEEVSLPLTLKTLMDSAVYFQRNHPGMHVAILIFNNVSTDETTAAVAQFYCEHTHELSDHHISIEVMYEGRPGKINGLKSGANYIRKNFAGKFSHVLFSDADVDWDEKAIYVLWEKAHTSTGKKPLLVGSNITPRNRITIWGLLESMVYYGYGSLPPRNQGIFMKFISGMGYLADASVLFHFDDMNDEVSSDDVAISALVGPENIYIAADAIVKYDLSEAWHTFKRIRARHVRDILRLEKWMSARYGEKKAAEMISSVAELGVFQITNGFFKPPLPLEPLDGSFYENFKKIIRYIYSVPAANYPVFYLYVGLLGMPTVYPYLIIGGIMQLYKASWTDALVGFSKKLFLSSYVSFMQNKKPKTEDKEQVALVAKDWDPALQRKSKGRWQSKDWWSRVRNFLSNNLNWAFAIIAVIELLIYEFVLSHTFLFASDKMSSLAENAANTVQGFLGSLSKTLFYIGHHIPVIAVIICFFTYMCLLGFYLIWHNKIGIGSKFVDSLKNTNKKFLKIAAWPFIAFEKIILFPIIVPLTFARLIFKKIS